MTPEERARLNWQMLLQQERYRQELEAQQAAMATQQMFTKNDDVFVTMKRADARVVEPRRLSE